MGFVGDFRVEHQFGLCTLVLGIQVNASACSFSIRRCGYFEGVTARCIKEDVYRSRGVPIGKGCRGGPVQQLPGVADGVSVIIHGGSRERAGVSDQGEGGLRLRAGDESRRIILQRIHGDGVLLGALVDAIRALERDHRHALFSAGWCSAEGATPVAVIGQLQPGGQWLRLDGERVSIGIGGLQRNGESVANRGGCLGSPKPFRRIVAQTASQCGHGNGPFGDARARIGETPVATGILIAVQQNRVQPGAEGDGIAA